MIDTGIEAYGLIAGDLLLVFMIVIAWPIYNYVNLKRNPVEKVRDDPNLRIDSYNLSLLQLWGMTGGIVLVWMLAGRPFHELGFQHVLSWQLLAVWGTALLGVLYSAVTLYRVHTSEAARQKLSAQLRDVGEMTHLLMPKTDKEYRRAILVGITAGITEEVIFRGYLIFVFALFMPIWLAGGLSIFVFTLLHIYQEKSGLLQVTLFAVFATGMYIIGGSLWPVIFLHIGVDVLNLSLARRIGDEIKF